MGRTVYTADQKTEALELYVRIGAAETARRTGIPKATLTTWAMRDGLKSYSIEKTAAAIEASRAALEVRKLALAEGLLDDAAWLRGQLRQACVEKVVKTVGTGRGESVTEIVDVDRDEPTFSDKKAIMTTIAIAVDKVQLLTGAPTERHEHVGVFGEEQAVGLRDELAERRRAS